MKFGRTGKWNNDARGLELFSIDAAPWALEQVAVWGRCCLTIATTVMSGGKLSIFFGRRRSGDARCGKLFELPMVRRVVLLLR